MTVPLIFNKLGILKENIRKKQESKINETFNSFTSVLLPCLSRDVDE